MTAASKVEKARRQAYIHSSVGAGGLEQVYAPYIHEGTGASTSPTAEAVARFRTTSNSAGPRYKVVLDRLPPSVFLHPTPAENLTLVRQVLKPSVLELATIFGVSRQAVHAWQNGALPNPESESRLSALAQAAMVFAEAGVTVNAQTLHRKISGGETLLNSVLHGKDAVQAAHHLVQTLMREDAQRAQLNRQLAGREPMPVRAHDYGAPHLPED